MVMIVMRLGIMSNISKVRCVIITGLKFVWLNFLRKYHLSLRVITICHLI